MQLRGLVDEDFVNYKKASMFLILPFCSFKCEKDCGIKCCQNSEVPQLPIVNIPDSELVSRYLDNPITKAIVLGGMEPFDSFGEVIKFIRLFREKCEDTIVIYTGYREDEIQVYIEALKHYSNIIVKFGRFVPNDVHKFDEILGVTLASANQYAKKIG